MDAKLIVSYSGIVTALLAIAAFVMSIFQRKKELRWKQAELARKLIDDSFGNRDAEEGFYMLDGLRYPYKDFLGNSISVSAEDVVEAIEKSLAYTELSDKLVRILFCVDSLLFFLNRIESSLKSKLIVFEDICAPCTYYVSLMAPQKDVFSSYMQRIGYGDLLKFCERFEVWNSRNL